MPISRVDANAATERDKAYFMVLGEFYHAYTSLEHHLTCCIRNAVTAHVNGNTEFKLIVAVLGGMRMAPLKDTLKRLLRILEADKAVLDHFDKLFHQLGEIQWLRDRLAHHFTYPVLESSPQRWVNQDYAAVREQSKSEDVEFELPTIQNATRDLDAIKFASDGIFSGLARGNKLLPPAKSQAPSWHYKPSQLTRRRPRFAGTQE